MFLFKIDDEDRNPGLRMRMTLCNQSGDSLGRLPPFPEEPAGFTTPTLPTAPRQAFFREGKRVYQLFHEHSYCVTSPHFPQSKYSNRAPGSLNLHHLMSQEFRSPHGLSEHLKFVLTCGDPVEKGSAVQAVRICG